MENHYCINFLAHNLRWLIFEQTQASMTARYSPESIHDDSIHARWRAIVGVEIGQFNTGCIVF